MDELDGLRREIAIGIYKSGMLLTWYRDKPSGWILMSGAWSPFYINLRPITSFPQLYEKIIDAFCIMLEKNGIDREKYKAVGIAMGGISIANGVALKYKIPSLYTRKLPDEVKSEENINNYIASHGQHALVEGIINNGDNLILFDDVVTSMDSKMLAINQINYEIKKRGLNNVNVKEVYVVVDRGKGEEKAKEKGLSLHSIIKFDTFVDLLGDKLSKNERDVIRDYLSNSEKFQDKNRQKELEELAKNKL